jgi:triphosphoribosyl-dephospho-CoA synthase
MDARLFMRSLFSLRHYFIQMAQAGAKDAPFSMLKELGIQAEHRMLAATGGVNTHRGAIFSLGLLCAATGYCHGHALPPSEKRIRTVLIGQWGAALAAHSIPPSSSSQGTPAAVVHAVGGAREEGAKGFPSVFEIALPQLRKSLAAGGTQGNAQLDALFGLMAQMTDTNIYHRGGPKGAMLVRRAARRFMSLGGTAHPDWFATAVECHRLFVSKRLSPGGAADMLAATWFVYQATRLMGNERQDSDD